MNNLQFNFSTTQKNIANIIFGSLIFFSLTYIYVPFIVDIFKKSNWIISNYSDNTINLQTIFFSIFCFLFLTFTSFSNHRQKDYIKKMFYALTLIILGLIIQIYLSYLGSKMSISELIQNELTISYSILFNIPTIIIFPELFKNIIDSFKLNKVPQKYALFIKAKFDIRLKRILSYLIDIFIICILSYIFSKIIVISPDISIMIILGLVIYFFTFETTFHTTIGKFLFGFKIHNINNNINFFRLRIFIRTIIRFVPLYPILVLFNKRGLHEYLSQTHVKIETIDD